MVRKLSLAVSLALGVASFDAAALGLGDIQIKSALYQSFNADIELLAVKKGAIDSVKVALASQETFEKAGVQRSFMLTKLRFTPERLPDGSSVIRVTSREPIREPFLNFLIEVNWPEGRMIREYTVLLDPPRDESRASPGGIATARTLGGPIIGASEEPIITPLARGEGETGVGAPPPPGGYGPVRAKETLWSIAKRFKYPEAEMDQMVMAILRANPHAFIDGHVNNMRKGVMLQIPSVDEVLTLNPMQARNQYRGQLASWSGAGPVATGQVARGKPAAKSAPAQAAGTRAGGGAKPSGELKIGAGGQTAAASGQVQRLEQELAVAQEAAESARRENDELRARLDALEAQIRDMQQLLALKDEQITQIQEQQAASSGAATQQPAAKPEPKPAPAQQPEPKPQPKPAEQPKPAQQPEPKPEPKPAQQPEPKPQPKPAQQPEPKPEPKPAQQPAPKPEPKPAQQPEPKPQPKPAQQPEPKPEPKPQPKKPEEPKQEDDMVSSVIDTVMDNIIYVAGGLGILLIGGGAAWFIRRRKSGEDGSSEPESILMSDASHGDSEMATEENPLSGLTTEETSFLDSLSSTGNFSEETDLDDGDETSFLSDFVPSDIEALQEETGEVDPLAEADVYIAYGRFKQAEELVRQAMDKDPSKQDYRFKLFEVLHAAKDNNGFSKLLAESSAMGLEKSSPEEWKRVMEMEQELTSGGGGPSDESDDLSDLDGLGDLSETEDLSRGDDSDDEDLDLDFSELGLDGDTEPSAGEAEPLTGEGEDDDDFDGLDLTGLMGDDAAAASESREPPAAGDDANDEESDELDFDLDFSEETTVTSDKGGSGSGESDEFSLDLDLDGGGDGGIPDLGSDIGDLPGEDDGLEVTGINKKDDEEGEFDFDLNTGLGEETDAPKSGGGASSAAASDVDPEEVATKLDLARAYIDMGDEEGAKDILGEVVNEGTDEQKAEAQGLLGQIG